MKMELRLLAALLLATAATTASSIREEDDFDYSCLPGIKPDIGGKF